jgi:hypothetical protein
VKLLLDEHVSPRVADALRASGHDVVAVSEVRELRGRSDDDILAQATRDERAVVTHNFADFLSIAGEWSTASRAHSGLVLVPIGFQRRGIGAYIISLEAILEAHPAVDALRDLIVWAETLEPRSASGNIRVI